LFTHDLFAHARDHAHKFRSTRVTSSLEMTSSAGAGIGSVNWSTEILVAYIIRMFAKRSPFYTKCKCNYVVFPAKLKKTAVRHTRALSMLIQPLIRYYNCVTNLSLVSVNVLSFRRKTKDKLNARNRSTFVLVCYLLASRK